MELAKQKEPNLWQQAHSGNIEGVKYWIEANGKSINAKDEDDRTPIHWASINGSTQLVSYLLQKGVNVNITGKNGSAIDVMVLTGSNPEIEKLLRDRLEVQKPQLKAPPSPISAPPQRESPYAPLPARADESEKQNAKGTSFAPIDARKPNLPPISKQQEIPKRVTPPDLPEDYSSDEDLPPKPLTSRTTLEVSGSLPAIDPNSYESLMTHLSQFEMEDEEKIFAKHSLVMEDDEDDLPIPPDMSSADYSSVDESSSTPSTPSFHIPSAPVFEDNSVVHVPTPQFD